MIISGILIIVLLGIAVVLSNDITSPIEYLPCRQPDTYCHQYNVIGTDANITFENTTGDLYYKVEG